MRWDLNPCSKISMEVIELLFILWYMSWRIICLTVGGVGGGTPYVDDHRLRPIGQSAPVRCILGDGGRIRWKGGGGGGGLLGIETPNPS